VRRPLCHAEQPDVGGAAFAAEFDARRRHGHAPLLDQRMRVAETKAVLAAVRICNDRDGTDNPPRVQL
jgi:hypothetical protein